MMPASRTLSVVMMQDDGVWVAQCLEFDIVAQAKSLEDLQYELERTIVSHCVLSGKFGREQFEGICPAPQEFFL